MNDSSSSPTTSWFGNNKEGLSSVSSGMAEQTVIKAQILQLGAALDRGQSYNPTSGPYYEETMKIAKMKIQTLIEMATMNPTNQRPKTLQEMEGEWELVLSTVSNNILLRRSMIWAKEEEDDDTEKTGLSKPPRTQSIDEDIFLFLSHTAFCFLLFLDGRYVAVALSLTLSL